MGTTESADGAGAEALTIRTFAAGRQALLERPSVLATSFGRRDYIGRRLLAAADAAGFILALAVALVLVSPRHNGLGTLLWGVLAAPGWIVLFKLYGLYDRDIKRISHTTVDDLPWLFHAFAIGSLLLWAYYRILPVHKLILIEVVSFGMIGITATLLLRAAMRAATRRALGPERVLLLGVSEVGPQLIEKIRRHPEYALNPIGHLSLHSSSHPALAGLPDFGGFDEVDFPALVAAHQIERIVVSPRDLDEELLRDLLHRCKEVSVKVSVLPQLIDALGPSCVVDHIAGVTLLGVNPPVLRRSSRMLKRALDLLIAVPACVLTAPLMMLIAVAIRFDSRGPVLFRQQRIGKGDQRFELLKFRTMVADAESRVQDLFELSEDPHWLKLTDDPRITRVGRLLRLTSIDELPQLWNVVVGQMSIVGPRPLVTSEDCQIDGWARSRLDLLPGVTGLWQVLGRTNIPFDEMVRLDYLYVTNWSLWTDVALILRTLPVVLRRRGAN